MDHLIDDEELPRRERELTLSTGSILAIFLGLAVLCGAFFGFGYNMGRKSAPTPLNLSDVNPDPSVPAPNLGGTSEVKPAAGSPMESSVPSAPAPTPRPVRHVVAAPPANEAALETERDSTVTKPATSASAKPTPSAAAPIVRQPVPVSPAALAPSASPAVASSGSYMVQVAAVSHQEDANLLVGALRARGYTVTTRNNGADNFIHVQVGPFRDKKDADAMRQRLLTDGYNAIVKQ